METSWVAALEPDLVALERLPDDPAAKIAGVYGPNPRGTWDAGRGAAQIDAAATLLAERVAGLLRGGELDTYADLRGFVDRYWPESLLLSGRAAGAAGDAPSALLIANAAPVSRYVSGLRLELDGEAVAGPDLVLVNRTAGETGIPIAVPDLGPERGFYVRRGQTAELHMRRVPPGTHDVSLTLELAGVRERQFRAPVVFE